MASYYTVYVTMNRLLKFIRKKTSKTTTEEACLDTSPPEVVGNDCCTGSSLPPDDLRDHLKDFVAQLNGRPISRQNALYTDDENIEDLVGLEYDTDVKHKEDCEEPKEEEDSVSNTENNNGECLLADVCESCESNNFISDNLVIDSNLNEESVTLDIHEEALASGNEKCADSDEEAGQAEKNDTSYSENERDGIDNDEGKEQFDIKHQTENDIDTDKDNTENNGDAGENCIAHEEDSSAIDDVFTEDDSACDAIITTPSPATTPDVLDEDGRCTQEENTIQRDDDLSIEEELRTVRRDLSSPTSNISFSSYSSKHSSSSSGGSNSNSNGSGSSSTISSRCSHTSSTKSSKKQHRIRKNKDKSRSTSNKKLDINNLPRSNLSSQSKFFETDSESECSITGNTDISNIASKDYLNNELPSDILDYFKLFDESNGNPYVTFSDVKSASSLFGILIHNNDCRKIIQSFTDRELKLIFDHMDEQQVGYITAQDIVKEMKKLGDFLTKGDVEAVSANENSYKRFNFSQFRRFCRNIDRSTNIVGVDEDDTKWMELSYIALNDCG